MDFIGDELAANSTAKLTFVFGHHPVTDTGQSDDTWLFYGHEDFIRALDTHRASTYNYGHTHDYTQALFRGNGYTGQMSNGGIHYYNVASLGKSSSANVSLVAVDCDGVSSVSRTWGSWPFVLITTPVDRYIGGALNPYAYTMAASSTSRIRALVFDAKAITSVSYHIDGSATWYPMNRMATGSPVYEGAWDSSALADGEHTIEVRAVGSTTVSDGITVQVTGGTPPAADTVTIVTATWTRKTKSLRVEATSTGAPKAVLTIQVPGYADATMAPVSGTNRYTYTRTTSSKPPTATVTSSLGGSATKTVSTK